MSDFEKTCSHFDSLLSFFYTQSSLFFVFFSLLDLMIIQRKKAGGSGVCVKRRSLRFKYYIGFNILCSNSTCSMPEQKSYVAVKQKRSPLLEELILLFPWVQVPAGLSVCFFSFISLHNPPLSCWGQWIGLSGRKNRLGSENVHSQRGKTLSMVVKTTLLLDCCLKFLVGSASRKSRERETVAGSLTQSTHARTYQHNIYSHSQPWTVNISRASISLICIHKSSAQKSSRWNMNYELIWIMVLQDCGVCSLISGFSVEREKYIPIPDALIQRTGRHTDKCADTNKRANYIWNQLRTFNQCGQFPARAVIIEGFLFCEQQILKTFITDDN